MSDKLSFGERAADWVSDNAGSWRFVIGSVTFILLWMAENGIGPDRFDIYPYILLNLVLSCVAALQAPIIMMSQGRKDQALRAYIAEIHSTTARDATLDEDTNRIIKEMAAQHAAQSALIAKIAEKVGLDA